MEPRRLQELCDACRPDHADWELPELADLHQLLESSPAARQQLDAAQSWERQVRQHCLDVPVPSDLEVRLLKQLTSPGPVVRRRSVWQLRLPAWGLGATVAIVLLLLAGFWLWPHSVDSQQLALRAAQWPQELIDPAAWSNDWQALQQTTRPMSKQLAVPERAWQQVAVAMNDTTIDSACTAYRLSEAAGRNSPILFVMRTRARLSTRASRPPAQPDLGTGSVACGVWREGNTLCALVVPGGVGHYQQLTHRNHASLPHAIPDGRSPLLLGWAN